MGNAVVLKPASTTPITGGLLFAKIYEEAGLPPGVLSVVVGPSGDIGDAVVTHPVSRLITFTGSTAVGRHIGALAGQHVKRSALELGGNAPFIVLDDADLDVAVNAAVFGKFLNPGQICMAINRVIVDRRVHDEFLERFATRVAALKCGDPSKEDTDLGPIVASVDVGDWRTSRGFLHGLLQHVITSKLVQTSGSRMSGSKLHRHAQLRRTPKRRAG